MMSGDSILQRLVEESEKRATTRRSFDLYGKQLVFKSNSPEVGNEITQDLKDFQGGLEGGTTTVYGFLENAPGLTPYATPPPEAILVWKNLDHSQYHYKLDDTLIMYNTKDEAVIAVTFSSERREVTVCFSSDREVLYELCLYEIEKRAAKLLEKEGKWFLHASSVEIDGKGLVFPAESGFGKTFITLVLLNNGHRLLADDKTLVDPASMTIFPYARRLRFDQRSADVFPVLRPFLKSEGRRYLNYKAKYFVDAKSVWPGSQGSECQLASIIFPTVWVNSSSKIIPCRTEQALSRLLTSMKPFHQELTRSETARVALDLATRVPCYYLLIGTEISGIEKAIRTGIGL